MVGDDGDSSEILVTICTAVGVTAGVIAEVTGQIPGSEPQLAAVAVINRSVVATGLPLLKTPTLFMVLDDSGGDADVGGESQSNLLFTCKQ
ncbi:hypothetical protein DERP_000327 [Dermatophagoides pteronyssinus]|uniref:Uncharacterized protein n=1 Tax=Dermatophagoides pteronyssinus TaxID=6956 RepID=A0ABQ8IZW6_DERPT|nr:hypothetical protein DERP_000327 [Dermatophagoides pteronyssinus]